VDAENPPSRERINLLKVPLDIVSPERLIYVVNELLASGEGKNIVLLSIWDLLRARRHGEYRSYILSASLIIPISKSLVGGARFLTGKKVVRYMPFDFIIQLLTILETRELTVYLLGGKLHILRKAEKNVHDTFPHLHIVGRYAGSFKKQDAKTILEAIRKATPSLVLVGKGVQREELWIAKNHTQLSQGLRLWCSDMYDIFAARKRHPSRFVFDHGLEWIPYCFQNPLRFFRIFPYLYYKVLLLVYRIFKKEG
jgi:N-acetylglucosaminyldiphosphoundecaprenol N-acetyl-beta-D-mannosaminyltransferase